MEGLVGGSAIQLLTAAGTQPACLYSRASAVPLPRCSEPWCLLLAPSFQLEIS